LNAVTDTTAGEKTSLISFTADALAFGLGIAFAWYTGWQTTDLVWTLWLSSLLIGFLTITMTILGGASLVWRVDQSSAGATSRPAILGIGLFMSAILLIFFSFHFCGFHAGHASFLSSFFPVPALESVDFHGAFMNPVDLLSIALMKLLPVYGWLMIPMLIAEREGFINAFKLDDLRSRLAHGRFPDHSQESSPVINPETVRAGKRSLGQLFTAPYRNIVRMHLVIIAFAVLQFLSWHPGFRF
jgi:hypothetical protein